MIRSSRRCENSRFLIVVCSPYTPRSKWVAREIEIFKQLGRGERVLALLTEGEPHNSFPSAVLERTRIIEKPDGTTEIVKENTEPLAADVRPRKGVKDRVLKEQALLRLVACILGVSYDTLRQRERERARLSWRRNAAIAATALIMLAGASLGYWEYTQPMVAHYREMVWRWGLPEGLGAVGEETRRHRERNYRFITQMGRVLEVRVENSAGRQVPDDAPDADPTARWIIEYTSDGVPTRIDHFDEFDRPLFQEALHRDGNRLLVSFENRGAQWSLRARRDMFIDQQTLSRSEINRSDITRYLVTFDEQGFAVELRYQDPWGIPRPDADNSYGERKSYSPGGLLMKSAKIGADGGEQIGKSGDASVASAYDEQFAIVSRTFLDARGHPINGSQHFASINYSHDKWGNIVSQVYLGEDGKPIANDDGFTRVDFRYDERGYNIEKLYFGADGAPTSPKLGCASLIMKPDERGNELEARCFGLDGKPTLHRDGYHKWVVQVDEKDRYTSWSHFGTDGKPVLIKGGFARLTFAYDSNNYLVEQEAFGVDGKPTLTANGFAKVTLRFDDRGQLVEAAYWGVDGQPAASRDGFAHVTLAYDPRGNLTEQSYYGVNGKLILSRNGVARWRAIYDSRGNQTGRANFGVDGRPVLDAQGVASYARKFDDRGNLIERAFLGIDGAPTLHKNGCAKIKAKFDEHGRLIDGNCLGTDGQPKLNEDMCASWRDEYDGYGRVASSWCFDAAGAPTLRKSGFARVIYRYDERNRLIDTRFFDASGRQVERELAVSAVKPSSQAAKLGIAMGDRLVSYDEIMIRTKKQLRELTEQAGWGVPHTLVLRRGAENRSILAQAGPLGIDLKVVVLGVFRRAIRTPLAG